MDELSAPNYIVHSSPSSLGKSYEITYVRLKFHTSRPESFAIYKRSRADGPWIPYQYYSASCGKTYRKQERQYLRPGENEQTAFCTEEFSDISPLSGGNVAFSTLEGRPSAYSFDESPVLQVLGSGVEATIRVQQTKWLRGVAIWNCAWRSVILLALR